MEPKTCCFIHVAPNNDFGAGYVLKPKRLFFSGPNIVFDQPTTVFGRQSRCCSQPVCTASAAHFRPPFEASMSVVAATYCSNESIGNLAQHVAQLVQ